MAFIFDHAGSKYVHFFQSLGISALTDFVWNKFCHMITCKTSLHVLVYAYVIHVDLKAENSE